MIGIFLNVKKRGKNKNVFKRFKLHLCSCVDFFTHDAVFFKNFTTFLFESKKDGMPSCMVNSAETRNVTV